MPSLDQLYSQNIQPTQTGQQPLLDSLYSKSSPTQQPATSDSIWASLAKGASGIVSSVEQPFVSLAAKPVQLLAQAIGQPDPYSHGVPAGIPGLGTTATITPPTIKGTAGDVLKAGSEIGAAALAPATIGGAALAGAGVGAAQGAGQALQNNAPIGEVAKQGAIGGVIGGVTGGAVAGLGHLIGATGDKIMTSVIKPSRADVADGFSIKTVKDFNLGGSLNTTLEKTQQTMNDLTSQLSEKLGASGSTVDLNTVAEDTVKELTDASKLKGFGANTKIANALEQLKQEVQIVNPEGGLSIPDAQIIKQAAGGFGAWQYGKPDTESKAQEIVYNTFYNKLKTAIEQNSPDGVRDINQQLSKLIPVANAVIRRLPVAERSNAISLNEMIGLVGSTFHPAALGPTVLNMVSRSGAAGSLLSKLGPAASRLAVPASLASGQMDAQAQDTPPNQVQ